MSATALVFIGLLMAGWVIAAAAIILSARERVRQARSARAAARRLARMIENSPAIPLLVKGDGGLEGSPRLASWLGLERLPNYLSELQGEHGGLVDDELERLRFEVRRTLKTAAPFRMNVTPRNSARTLAVCGQYADRQVAPDGAALVWWFDASESDEEVSALRNELALLRIDFTALFRLIEAAPIAMWFRGPDLGLRIVNAAYAEAVGARDAAEVVNEQIELVEAVDGRSAAEIAGEARDSEQSVERVVYATVGGQRRAVQVVDLPLGDEGVAGFALDIEEQASQGRALRDFTRAQRSMLDLLSVGVAQFDYERRLAYANKPFLRLFGFKGEVEEGAIEFRQFLDRAREVGRLPETGDFPAWRRTLGTWFSEHDPVEEAWTLSDGTHLRVVGIPMPDGSLVMLAEDRSEQFALSARRDILLRTRATMLDNLGEALAIFGPDGSVQLWNRRFRELWQLSGGPPDTHVRAEEVTDAMATRLADPAGAETIGESVRAATLERESDAGRIDLADGRQMDFATVPLPDGTGLLVMRDMSAKAQAEAALRERDAVSEAAVSDKAALLAALSGEVRSTLLRIGLSAEALRNDEDSALSARGGEQLAAIFETAHALDGRLDGLLAEASGQAGAPAMETEVELLPLVTALLHEREAAIEARRLTVNLRGDRRAGTILADERQLPRALGTLVDEAVAHAPAGSSIAINIVRSRKEARIEIAWDAADHAPDDGGAATALELSQVGEGTQARHARRVIEAHGGQLRRRSEPGRGNQVSVTFA